MTFQLFFADDMFSEKQVIQLEKILVSSVITSVGRNLQGWAERLDNGDVSAGDLAVKKSGSLLFIKGLNKGILLEIENVRYYNDNKMLELAKEIATALKSVEFMDDVYITIKIVLDKTVKAGVCLRASSQEGSTILLEYQF